MYYEKIGYKRVKVPKYIIEPKNIDTAIRRAEKWLYQQAYKYGLWENFGQGVIRALQDKYIDISSYSIEMNSRRKKLNNFNKYVMTMGDKHLPQRKKYEKIWEYMRKKKIRKNEASPNRVNVLAWEMGIKLTSEEVIYIYDNY